MHLISLGYNCYIAHFLQQHNLRKAAYPFDWVFTCPEIVIDCLKNNFTVFLDKQHFRMTKCYDECVCEKCTRNGVLSGHAIYGTHFFRHKNVFQQEDFEYYQRCVRRWNKLFDNDDNITFILLLSNRQHYTNETLHHLCFELHSLLSNQKSVILIFIFHTISADFSFTSQTLQENLYFCHLTCSKNKGTSFENKNDNVKFADSLLELLSNT